MWYIPILFAWSVTQFSSLRQRLHSPYFVPGTVSALEIYALIYSTHELGVLPWPRLTVAELRQSSLTCPRYPQSQNSMSFILNLLCRPWPSPDWKIHAEQQEEQTSKRQPFKNPAILASYRHRILNSHVKIHFWRSPSYLTISHVCKGEKWMRPGQNNFLLASLLSRPLHSQKANRPTGFCFNSGTVVRFESASSRANSSLILYNIKLCNCGS